MFKKALNPDLYHGHKKKKKFFEGWYYKIVDKENKNVIALIPGISKGETDGQHHAFIQILDGSNQKSHYIKYGVNSFKASKDTFEVSISNNYFSLHEVRLNHYKDDIQMLGTLKFIDLIKWPDTKLNPGSMGFYNYLSFMECYSQVSCLDGSVVGKLLINNNEIDFTGGRVYIEKNWGSNFPKAYLWLQSNSFKYEGTSFTCSLGRVPMPIFSFSGFLAAFTHNGEVYKFTTINKAKYELTTKGHHNVKISFFNKKKTIRLNVETIANEKDYLDCKGPNLGQMNIEVKESITSKIKLELLDFKKERLLFSGTGECAGIEMMGNLNKL